MQALSSTKGGIYVPQCDFSSPLFPLTRSPLEWRACEDAYTFTWTVDPDKHLLALTDEEKARLARSMGFCPHRRCQLHTLTGTHDGLCPAGLCYTKIEYGSPSFGACCFVGSEFHWGDLVGHEGKCQTQPKPIYKKNRVVLGDPLVKRERTHTHEETMRDAYAEIEREKLERGKSLKERILTERDILLTHTQAHINTHTQAHNGTACVHSENGDHPTPQHNAHNTHAIDQRSLTVTESPSRDTTPPYIVTERLSQRDLAADTSIDTFVNANMIFPHLIATQCVMRATVRDVREMIAQEHVDLWIQLSHPSQVHSFDKDAPSDKKSEDCYLLTDALLRMSEGVTVTPTQVERPHVMERYHISFDTQTAAQTATGSDHTTRTHKLEFFWFKEWDDFKIPEEQFEEDVSYLVSLASAVLSRGGTVVVNCHSGRGRSGTLSALIAGTLTHVTRTEELVSLIVSMRESRDGLVETPQQFRFAAKMLSLGDTGSVNVREIHAQKPSHTPHSDTLRHATHEALMPRIALKRPSEWSLPSQLEAFAPLLCMLGVCVILLCSGVWKRGAPSLGERRRPRSPLEKRETEP